jgi:hypothetical protein
MRFIKSNCSCGNPRSALGLVGGDGGATRVGTGGGINPVETNSLDESNGFSVADVSLRATAWFIVCVPIETALVGANGFVRAKFGGVGCVKFCAGNGGWNTCCTNPLCGGVTNCGGFGAVCAGFCFRGLPRRFLTTPSAPIFTTTDCFETCEIFPSLVVVLTEDLLTAFFLSSASFFSFFFLSLDLLRDFCNGIVILYDEKKIFSIM